MQKLVCAMRCEDDDDEDYEDAEHKDLAPLGRGGRRSRRLLWLPLTLLGPVGLRSGSWRGSSSSSGSSSTIVEHLESIDTGRVLDYSLLAVGIDEAILTLHGAVGQTTLLAMTAAVTGAVTELREGTRSEVVMLRVQSINVSLTL